MSKRVKIVMEAEVWLGIDVPRDLDEGISRLFSELNDGRRPFEVEMVERGLVAVVERAARRALETRFAKIYGNYKVEAYNFSSEYKFRIAAREAAEDLSACVVDGVKVVSAEETAD